MERRNEISDELVSLGSSLAAMPRTMPYIVPGNYFDTLCSDLVQNIHSLQYNDPTLLSIKDNPYSVPQHYFEQLPAQILAHVNENSDSLKTNPFTAPKDYFNSLPAQMLEAAKASEHKKETKVLPLYGKPLNYIKWAAAAILIAALGFGSFKYFVQQQSGNSETTILAKIPDSLLNEYAQQNFDDFDVYMNVNNLVASNSDKYTQQLSSQDIEQYFDEIGLGKKNID